MKYILLTGLLLGSLTVQAQVSGTVKDQAGEPIIGANVFWKNIPGGVATREDGTFSISKPDRGSHLIVSRQILPHSATGWIDRLAAVKYSVYA